MSAELDEFLGKLEVRSKRISSDVVATIREEVPAYADFPLEHHRRDIRLSVAAILTGVRQRRMPSADAIEHAREMGRHRARFGLPLHDAIAGYHIGYRELWSSLLAVTRQERPDLMAELVEKVTLLWNWIQRLSAAFANAYDEESRSMLTSQLATRQRLVRNLSDDTATRDQRDDLARALGFAPDGVFLVACATLRDDPDIAQLNEVLDRVPGIAHGAAGPAATTVIVTQGVPKTDIVDAIREVFPDAPIAFGLTRSGTTGAAAGLADAVEAAEHAKRTGQVLDYEEDWLLSVIAARGGRLDPLFAPGTTTAAQNTHLAHTVRSYLASRYSTTICARALNLHPNSVKYRLQRWTELTGWDLHTVDGLVRSAVALQLAAVPDAD